MIISFNLFNLSDFLFIFYLFLFVFIHIFVSLFLSYFTLFFSVSVYLQCLFFRFTVIYLFAGLFVPMKYSLRIVYFKLVDLYEEKTPQAKILHVLHLKIVDIHWFEKNAYHPGAN